MLEVSEGDGDTVPTEADADREREETAEDANGVTEVVVTESEGNEVAELEVDGVGPPMVDGGDVVSLALMLIPDTIVLGEWVDDNVSDAELDIVDVVVPDAGVRDVEGLDVSVTSWEADNGTEGVVDCVLPREGDIV